MAGSQKFSCFMFMNHRRGDFTDSARASTSRRDGDWRSSGESPPCDLLAFHKLTEAWKRQVDVDFVDSFFFERDRQPLLPSTTRRIPGKNAEERVIVVVRGTP